jgi:hypothetical protein
MCILPTDWLRKRWMNAPGATRAALGMMQILDRIPERWQYYVSPFLLRAALRKVRGR